MSIFPRKYHGPELKCGGPSMCRDCADRVKDGIGFDEWYKEEKPVRDIVQDLESLSKIKDLQEKQNTPCTCVPRVLFWKGCVCKNK